MGKTILANVLSPEERRLVILRGIGQDHTSSEIAAELGVRMRTVRGDLKAMMYHRDPDLKQAYIDQKIRALTSSQKLANMSNERFKLMTGMTFQDKNFDNMVNYYQPELIKILRSEDEDVAISGLAKSVRRTLARYEIINGSGNRHRISSRVRDYLLLRRLGG